MLKTRYLKHNSAFEFEHYLLDNRIVIGFNNQNKFHDFIEKSKYVMQVCVFIWLKNS